MTEIINTLADFVLLSALVPIGFFVVRYFLFSPYQVTPEGRNNLHKKLALLSLVAVVLLSLFLGAGYFGREWVRLTVFSAITYFYWVETAQLMRVQKQYPYNRWAWLKRFRSKSKE